MRTKMVILLKDGDVCNYRTDADVNNAYRQLIEELEGDKNYLCIDYGSNKTIIPVHAISHIDFTEEEN